MKKAVILIVSLVILAICFFRPQFDGLRLNSHLIYRKDGIYRKWLPKQVSHEEMQRLLITYDLPKEKR